MQYRTLFPLANRSAHENLICCSIAGFVRAPAGERLFRNNLPEYEIFYVTAGKGELIVENTSRSFQKGDLILLHLHTNHGYIADTSDPYECFFITFQHRNITCLLGDWLHVHNPIFAHVAQDKIHPLFEEIMQHAEQQRPCWDAQISALIYLLLMHFYSEVCGEWERETLEPDWVATTRQWIEQNLEHDITVGMLAEQAHISMYHFIREFKKYFHMSPLEYIILRRVNRAKYLLMKSDQNIYQIGRDAGFPSHSSMIRNFKRIEGNTPSGFRTSIQGNQRSR